MDRNTFIGIALIIAIFGTFTYLNRDTPEQIQAKKEQIAHYTDSIQELKYAEELAAIESSPQENETVEFNAINDSLLDAKLVKKYDVFAVSAKGTDAHYTIENEELRLTFASKGGAVVKAELLKYQNYKNCMIAKDSLVDVPAKDLPILEPLALFDEDSTKMFFNIPMQDSRSINTNELYFTPVVSEGNKIVLRAKTSTEGQFIEMKYELLENYDVDFSLDFVGLQDVVKGEGMNLNWEMKSLLTEKEPEGQSRMSSVFYKPSDDGRTYLSEMSEDSEELESKTDWVAFKHCYFSSVVISKEGFQAGGEVYSNPITKINFIGLNNSSETSLLETIPFEVGQNFSPYASDEIIESLFKTGLFENISIIKNKNSINITLKENSNIKYFEINLNTGSGFSNWLKGEKMHLTSDALKELKAFKYSFCSL